MRGLNGHIDERGAGRYEGAETPCAHVPYFRPTRRIAAQAGSGVLCGAHAARGCRAVGRASSVAHGHGEGGQPESQDGEPQRGHHSDSKTGLQSRPRRNGALVRRRGSEALAHRVELHAQCASSTACVLTSGPLGAIRAPKLHTDDESCKRFALDECASDIFCITRYCQLAASQNSSGGAK